MPEQVGRDILTGWTSATGERYAWKQAYTDLMIEFEGYQEDVRATNNKINEQLGKERAAWKASTKKGRALTPGFYVGYGYGGFSFGVGLVWSPF